jgi:dihydroorotate dehydrogenase electron transfer subunit
MVKSLSKVLKSKKWIVQVSLEARMGCGFGACWGCVVKTKNTEMVYQRVCKDGSVFPLSEIVWE